MKTMMIAVVMALTTLGGLSMANAQGGCSCLKDAIFPVFPPDYWVYYGINYPAIPCDDEFGESFGTVCRLSVCGEDAQNCGEETCGDCTSIVLLKKGDKDALAKLPKYSEIKDAKGGLEVEKAESAEVKDGLGEKLGEKNHRSEYYPQKTMTIRITGRDGKKPVDIYAKISKLVSDNKSKGPILFGVQVTKPAVEPFLSTKGWNVVVPTVENDKLKDFEIPGLVYAKVGSEVYIVQIRNDIAPGIFPNEAP